VKYIVSIRYARIRRFLAQDAEGWHTTNSAKATQFKSQQQALEAVDQFGRTFGAARPVQFSVLPCRPDGVVAGS
jgi:hypothetical protein